MRKTSPGELMAGTRQPSLESGGERMPYLAGEAPGGPAGGGLTGTYPNPTVASVPRSALPPGIGVGTPNVVYVSKTGSDTNTGEEWGSAFLTIKKAVETLEATTAKTGTIYIGYGTWKETGVVKKLSGGNIYGQGGRNFATIVELPNATEANVIQDQYWGNAKLIGTGGEINHLAILGNHAGNEGWTSPGTLNTSSKSVTSAGVTLESLSTTGFPAGPGTLWVGQTLCTYVGISGNNFTEVKPANGTTFTAGVEMVILPGAGIGHGIALQSERTIIGSDVFIEGCNGSGVALQGAGETGLNCFECLNMAHRIEECQRYGFEILPFAPDGMVAFNISAINALGAYFIGSGEWQWINIHPVGNNESKTFGLSRQLIRICRRQQNFLNLDLDNAPYGAIRLDGLAMGETTLNDIQVQGFSQHAVSGASNAGSLLQFYGGATSKAERISLVGIYPGRWDYVAAPYPHSYLVGEQNLKTISEATGQVQVLSALDISPTSALGGKLKFASGDELNYTGTSSAQSSVRTAVSSGSATLELKSITGFAASGIVTVAVQSTSITPTPALRVKYTKITGKVLEGCTGITENIAVNTGVAQHFITGVTGGTNNAVADNTAFSQLEREIKTISGEAKVLTGAGEVSGEGGLFNTIPVAGYKLRFIGENTTPTGEGENIVVPGVAGVARKCVGALSGNGIATKFKFKHGLETKAVVTSILTETFEEPITMLAKVVSIGFSEVEVTFTLAPSAKSIFYIVVVG